MATWYAVANHIRENYKIADEQQGFIKMIFDVGDLRSQVVFVNHQVLLDGAEEWIHIESPFAKVDDVDLPKLLSEVGTIVCGGASRIGDVVTLRHAVPLANLDINEFERPLILVTTTADRLERRLVGSDAY